MAAEKSERDAALRGLPKIDEVLGRADISALAEEHPRWALRSAVRELVDRRRQAILDNSSKSSEAAIEPRDWSPVAGEVAEVATRLTAPSLRRLVNATGVVLHTNFGRAPLPAAAIEAIVEIGAGYSNLEYDVDRGKRGSRHGHLLALIRELCGAADAAVVNNNAAATMLGLAALAAGREVIVSRGELVEIGGSFRIPDVMRLSGATLVEVGTTNKTRIKDYADAITSETGLLLKVHQSNFAIVGFSEETPAGELAELARERGIASMYDLGSGSLLSGNEMIEMGLAPEESVGDAISAGIDLVTFSGDKLLGGPQAGLLAGSQQAVERCRKHPLMRALRPDKLTIAALGATLSAYRDAGVGRPPSEVPTMAMLGEPLGSVRKRAEALLTLCSAVISETINVDIAPLESTVGGGAMPLATLPSWGVSLQAVGDGPSADALDAQLRKAPVPVVGRVSSDCLVLDVRTIREGDVSDVVAAVASLGQTK